MRGFSSAICRGHRRLHQGRDADAGEAAPFNGRGKAQLALKRPAAAIRDFSRAIVLSNRYGQALANRAEAFFALRRYTDAVAEHDGPREVADGGRRPLQGELRRRPLNGAAFAGISVRWCSGDGPSKIAKRNRALPRLL